MTSNDFHHLKLSLTYSGYVESNRRFRDYFTREYIRGHDCPECEHFGLLPIIMRGRGDSKHFGKCLECGEVTEF